MKFNKLSGTGENVFYTLLVLMCIVLVLFQDRVRAIQYSVKAYLHQLW